MELSARQSVEQLAASDREWSKSNHPPDVSQRELYVVALGASAGGLEALEKFFDNMPANSGLSFVVVQHLSPDFKSLMNELLARHTKLPIHRVTDGMLLEPNSIYLIPPKKEMIVADGRLLLTDKDPAQGLSLPIDTFLRSLAHEFGRCAIAVILSGTGSDGSRGIRAIDEAGGFVVVQDESSAYFDGMPRSAIDTGVVDAVLPPGEIPAAILDYVQGKGCKTPAQELERSTADHPEVSEIFIALHRAYGIDFSFYKPTTVARRLERRLQLNHTTELDEYVSRLRTDRKELNSLYHDLLIGVTKFFRDEEAFRRLETDVLPQLLKDSLDEGDELRVWVAGCATGEEAYSIAILVQEAFAARQQPVRAKIFATDVHDESLEAASAGIFREEALCVVSQERLAKFFIKVPSGYQVVPELRKMIVFAPHNVMKDAPFTKLDLVCCRNLLIYFQPAAQKKALSLFHFALKTNGVLFLGPSESPGELTDEFDPIDRHWKLFRKRRDVRLPADFRLPLSPGLARWRAAAAPPSPDGRGLPEIQLIRAYDVLLNDFVPPSLMVNDRRELIHSFSGAGKFLSVPDGRPSRDILDLVEPDLKLALSGALQRAAKEKKTIIYGSVSLRSLGEAEQLRLSVRPITIRSTGEEFFLISFEPQKKVADELKTEAVDFDATARDRFVQVEEELRYTKENLQATIEEMETTNEELQATNEELVASNEELQSTNEELHSVNEELYTVNAEHQRKIIELTELTDDMDNLLRSTEIGTIFLDRELRIRKFTPQIVHAFQILPQDIGRSIDTFSHNILHDTLLEDVQRVAMTEKPFEKDLQDRHGTWFLLRILPYRTKGHVEGVVITLIDITGIKRAEAELRRLSKVFMDGADPIIIEDLDGRIVDANHEAARAYGWSREALIGQKSSVLVPPECIDQSLELRDGCRNAEHVRNVESLRKDRSGHVHPTLLTLSLLNDESGKPMGIATIAKDITAQKEAENEARQAVVRRDEFLAMLSHELRNPLGAVLNAAQLLIKECSTPTSEQASDVVMRQGRQMARLLDDLLDVSRVTRGKIDVRKEVVDLNSLVHDAVEVVRQEVDERGHQLELQVGDEPLYVEGDPSRLLQIQENLLVNAAKYTPQGGRIVLAIRRDATDAVITVEDNGQGIPSDMLAAIFELFVQGQKSLARSEGGMGIGLSLVKTLVELHGGTVSVQSEGKGNGSKFTVRLPLTHKNPAMTVSESPSDNTALKVLIVEDNDDSRTMLEKLLRIEGHQVTSATDGLAGYEAVRRESPDIVLLDIGLPKLDGFQVARRIRSELADRPIRLVALTGYGRAEDHEAVMAAGFDEHLIKPVGPRDLGRALRKPDG